MQIGGLFKSLLFSLMLASFRVCSIVWKPQKFPLNDCHNTDIDLVMIAYTAAKSAELSQSSTFQISVMTKLLETFLSPGEKNLTRLRVAVVSPSWKGPILQVEFEDCSSTDDLIEDMKHLSPGENITNPPSMIPSSNWLKNSLDFTGDLFSTSGRQDNTSHVVVLAIQDDTSNVAKALGKLKSEHSNVAKALGKLKSEHSVTDLKVFTALFINEDGNEMQDGEIMTDTVYFKPGNGIMKEIRLGMALCGVCPQDWLHHKHVGSVTELSCHKKAYSGTSLTWYQARSFCGKEYNGAQLSTVNTVEEKIVIENFINPYGSRPRLYIGLTRNRDSFPQRYRWINRRPLLVNSWDSLGVKNGLHAGCVYWQYDGWHDTSCDFPIHSWTFFKTAQALCEVTMTSFSKFVSLRKPVKAWKPKASQSDVFTEYLGDVISKPTYMNDYRFRLLDNENTILTFDCRVDTHVSEKISYSFVCDFINHCSNGRDEDVCEYRACDPVEEFRCASGQCIPTEARCDLFPDCIDASDEHRCDECKGRRCPDDERTCLPKHWFYDGEEDCPGDDGSMIYSGKADWSGTICAFICNRTECVSPPQLNDNTVDCTGPEGQLDETIGKIYKEAKCFHEILNINLWAPVCYYIKDRYGGVLGCRDMSHLHGCELFVCSEGYVKCPDAYCIPLHYVRNGEIDCPFGEDEELSSYDNCSGNLRCWRSEICVHPDLICDGVSHCPHGDDEVECHLSCSDGFICQGGIVTVGNSKKSQPLLDLSFIDARTRYVDLSNINLSSSFTEPQKRANFQNLFEMHFSGCWIKDALGGFARNVHMLATVYHADLTYNLIEEITDRSMFPYMTNLRYLDLSHNRKLRFIQEKGLYTPTKTSRLEVLNLVYTNIDYIQDKTFQGLTNLKLLNLSYTLISKLHKTIFPANFVLNSLDIRNLHLSEFHPDALKRLIIKDSLFSDNFALCCSQVRGDGIPEHTCHAPKDAISSCSDLVNEEVHRILLWTVGIAAVMGNILVILIRCLFDRQVLKKPYGIFVTNLSVADILMGVYLLIIAGADLYYRGDYVWHDKDWRVGNLCTLAGFLSTFSSETSAFFILLITFERFLVIKYPFGQRHFSPAGVFVCLVVAWTVGFTLALIPTLPVFDHWTIYSSNAMCLGLPLTTEHLAGWEYSTTVFIGLNFILFICIACGQWSIYRAMSTNRSRMVSAAQSSNRRAQDIEVAKQLSLVVLSDFLCWFPIGIMGLLALSGTDISKESYAWSAVLILPINSALNPLLYTLPVVLKKWENFKKGNSCWQSQASRQETNTEKEHENCPHICIDCKKQKLNC